MCASPLSPRHAQPDWMGGGLVSRQMMHAPPSAAISVSGESPRRWTGQADEGKSQFEGVPRPRKMAWQPDAQATAVWTAALLASARPEGGTGAIALSPQHCATMLIVAAGVLFSGSENARQELSSPTQITMGYGCHCKLLRPLRRTRWTESQA